MTTQRVVRQVDHLVTRTSDPEPLWTLLVETLQLPVAWPFASYGQWASGAVGLGNMALEVMRIGWAESSPNQASLIGIALEPEPLDESLAELQRRGIAHGDPELPHASEGHDQSWTQVTLVTLSETYAFLCAYPFDVELRGLRLRRELEDRGGGPMCLQEVRAISIGTPDYEGAVGRWQAVLDPEPSPSPGTWRPGRGPALELLPDTMAGIRSITLEVAGLAAARDQSRVGSLIETASTGEVRLAPSQVQGLDIRLVERGA